MIVIDTHVWVWWVDDNPKLKRSIRDRIDAENDVRVSAISILEIATAVCLNRMVLKPTLEHWFQIARTAVQI